MAEFIDSGWCCLWLRCRGIGVRCVRHEGLELCIECAEREGVAVPAAVKSQEVAA